MTKAKTHQIQNDINASYCEHGEFIIKTKLYFTN